MDVGQTHILTSIHAHTTSAQHAVRVVVSPSTQAFMPSWVLTCPVPTHAQHAPSPRPRRHDLRHGYRTCDAPFLQTHPGSTSGFRLSGFYTSTEQHRIGHSRYDLSQSEIVIGHVDSAQHSFDPQDFSRFPCQPLDGRGLTQHASTHELA